MSHGPLSVFPATVASFATASSEIDLARSWKTCYLLVPTMTSNTAIHIQASESSGGTFRRVKHPPINSSTVTTNDFTIASNATNCMVPMPNGFRYIKVETSAIVSFSAEFKIVCSD